MEEIRRLDVDENWADSAIIEAGDFVFVGMGSPPQHPKSVPESTYIIQQHYLVVLLIHMISI